MKYMLEKFKNYIVLINLEICIKSIYEFLPLQAVTFVVIFHYTFVIFLLLLKLFNCWQILIQTIIAHCALNVIVIINKNKITKGIDSVSQQFTMLLSNTFQFVILANSFCVCLFLILYMCTNWLKLVLMQFVAVYVFSDISQLRSKTTCGRFFCLLRECVHECIVWDGYI